MRQPEAVVVSSRRLREPLEGMANSGPLSARQEIRVSIVLSNPSGKYIRQGARQMGLFEINGASPVRISTPGLPVFSFIAS
jgi:hypothetical protein